MQGFNMGRYVPPEHEGLTSGNSLHNKKPPGHHGSKQTVRFEMPFSIICAHCSGHIAQGVRFNAEKLKVGAYFTTPIFSFRMKHSVCSGWLEVRTDPQNTAYVVFSGAKKMAEEGGDAGPKLIRITDPDPAEEDPFARAEKEGRDKIVVRQGGERIAELQGLSERQWRDPYAHSRKLRKVFREERKVLADKAAATEAILDRTGLAIKLLDEAPEDAQRAKLIDFGPEHSLDHHLTKSLFEKEPPADRRTERITDAKGKLKSRIAVERTKEELQKSLVRNTRAVIDPFLGQHERPRSGLGIRIQKRKAKDMGATEPPRNSAEPDTGKTVGQKPERANGVQKPQMSLGLDYSSE